MGTNSVGGRIAALRSVKGLTGEQLGHALGLTKSQVSKIESGVRKLDVSEIALVADALGVTLAEVLGVERRGSLALAARVMTTSPGQDETAPARRRVRQVLEVEAALGDAVGLPAVGRSAAGTAVVEQVQAEGLAKVATVGCGTRLAGIVRERLGLGRAPIGDLAALVERHFGMSAVTWPVGKVVSGLCAHGTDTAMMLISSSFPVGHQRFTAAHELAHHLLADPREVIIESDVFAASTPSERRANSFAAGLLMPADGLRDVVNGRAIDDIVIAELMREFGVSYTALLHRLTDPAVKLISTAQRGAALQRTPTSVLRTAGDPSPAELTQPDETRRVPPRLLSAAQHGYRSGKVGLGVLASLLDEDADLLYERLAAEGITPPVVQDDMGDL
ncbi:ImmA/IrrE family metallo-endopeptidase [Dactylosporangium roseum]|uniref:ImmA/IrrE family metallo-endopeptidase n=1 Tax=Dactylosporangium roseum TaxID=47989 RepID=A0ABY5ZEY9_9ACTN|nr:ImmA/IrrE family metallo-endopeptidase [Dactylosporangium roseum]UWZ39523.1 ImmA/IrrE family metallo-endopeptidase [Dactylosporangium roseum]